jgi:threonine dehydrogenase-like Zn-dependent dehydrogenase
MRAVVYRSVGDIGLEDVPEPRIEAPTDAIVRITTTAICGTDLHLIRGTLPGTVLGHEAVGVVEEVGRDARNLGPESTGPFNGLQAEFARVPFAATGLVRVPDDMADDDAILVTS